MKTLLLIFSKKKELIIILVGIIISFTIASKNLEKFDKIVKYSVGEPRHLMLTSDMRHVWEVADKFRSDLSQGKSFTNSLPIYDRAFLQPILIGYYYYLLDKEIFDKNENDKLIIKTKNFKFWILSVQIFLFYVSIYFFFTQYSKTFYNKDKKYFPLILLLFFCFEPSILQWHSSFWSESIYLTLLIIVLTLLIKKSESITINFLIGFLLGLMYLQKAYSFLFIIPIIIFFLLVHKKKILSLITLIIGYIFIMLFIGLNHLQKQDSFYLLSSKHEYYSYYHYFAAGIYADRKNIDPKLAKIKIDNFEKKWRQENNIKIIYPILNTDKQDLDKILEYRNNFFLNEVKQNPIYFFKLLIKKTIVMCILHPTWVYENYMLDKSSKEANENPRKYFHKSMNRNIFYSLIIYFFVLIGLKDFFLKLHKSKKFEFYDKFLIFNILSILYFIGIAGLWGQPRYFTPCLINISFFFAYGASNILSKFKK
jgi:hypothetical protein